MPVVWGNARVTSCPGQPDAPGRRPVRPTQFRERACVKWRPTTQCVDSCVVGSRRYASVHDAIWLQCVQRSSLSMRAE
eukprot:353435-Chlamydomonas_euryale.AAC.9